MSEVMEWRPCPGFPRYEISEFGHLRRADSKRPRKSVLSGIGYPSYGLTSDGKCTTVTAHSLVALAFIGPKPFDGAEICHGDNNKTNCHYTNLRWDTRAGNRADSAGLVLLAFQGENNHQAKLQEPQVREMRRLRQLGLSQKQIGKEFNVSQSVVCDIVNRKLWAHVD